MNHNHQSKGENNKHEGHKVDDFLKKFIIAFFITIPIFFYSEMAMDLLGLQGSKFLGWQYVLLFLGSIVYFYCGWVFIEGAYRELRARLPGMMTLIAIAITTAYGYSFVSLITETGHDLLFELTSLVAVMLLGHWVEMRSIKGTQGALKELSKLLPDTADVVHGEMVMTMALTDLRVGDVVLVKPGAKIPADGLVVEGRSEVNEAVITGESNPILKEMGNGVVAGSCNGDGSLKVRIVKIGEETFLAGVVRLIAEAQASKSRLQLLSDRAALYLTFVALSVGVLAFIFWVLDGAGVVFAAERLVAVLVVACPHALGLAVPLVAAISTAMAARNGLLVRERLALEVARKADVVLFDKTGTLTEAKFKVVKSSSDEALSLAASVNMYSEHPIARAIREEAENRSLRVVESSDFKRIPGRGAEGFVEGMHIFVGTRGGEDIVVERDGLMLGVISVVDAVRPEAQEAVRGLKEFGVQVMMITGDSEQASKRVAQELGIDEYFARVLPEDKVKKIKEFQARGMRVVMVGDGINDAPALTQADVGVAIGAGTNVAIESAGIILIKNDPRDVVKIIRLSQLTHRKMVQNLFWATGYNIIAIPLAAGVFISQGVILEPAIAAILMSASTVLVAINAVLLKRISI